MPEISRFYGIVVQMYFGDHPPAHFHARYSGHNVKIDIDTLGVIEGQFPPRALGLVTEWAALHQAELRDAFDRVVVMKSPGKIDPLS
jgi:hypothetical protein